MASKYWIKLYHEILDDPKMGRLSDRQYRRVIEIFLLAGDCEMDGKLPCAEDIAFRLRYPAGLDEDIEALLGCGILSRGTDGALRVTRWLERQTAMSEAERSRRRRWSARMTTGSRHERVTIRDTDIDIDEEEDQEKDEDADGSTLRGQGADIPEPLRQPGARTKGNGDVPAALDTTLADDDLVKLFMERTGLPLNLGGEEKWARALARLCAAEVEAGDLEQAIDECRSKGLTIVSLASVVTPAIIARAKRKAGRPEEDYRRYLKGEYGEFGTS
jgi:hypothetical protein